MLHKGQLRPEDLQEPLDRQESRFMKEVKWGNYKGATRVKRGMKQAMWLKSKNASVKSYHWLFEVVSGMSVSLKTIRRPVHTPGRVTEESCCEIPGVCRGRLEAGCGCEPGSSASLLFLLLPGPAGELSPEAKSRMLAAAWLFLPDSPSHVGPGRTAERNREGQILNQAPSPTISKIKVKWNAVWWSWSYYIYQ